MRVNTLRTSKPSIDYHGARGSNTGDQFHELWALLQVLNLLSPDTDLKAVGVEGVRSDKSLMNEDNPTWDGVDCALYYGGTTLETSNRIEFIQLKYSAANPEKIWSVARLIANSAKKRNNSVIRKMADDFKSAKVLMKHGAQLKIRLVSNQDSSTELKKALGVRWSGPLAKADIDKKTKRNLFRLIAATKLTQIEFQNFLKTLDFSECGSHSRFAVREKVVAIVADLLGDDVSSEVRGLQVRVRELMLPERSKEIVTDRDIFLWFGLSGREGLFPCPSDIQKLEHAVKRPAADEVVSLLIGGERLVLVYGVGGCGKTTLMHQIVESLPNESVTVLFDCFGGGRYIYSDDKRHLPENAFLHLANELAVECSLPLFIPRNSKYPATIKSFLAKLRSAGKALKKLNPNGILLIVVDAADNSAVAADAANPSEYPFVFDLFRANLSELPDNVHIIASCRTARRTSLRLPSYTPEVICPTFSPQETKQHLETVFAKPSDSIVKQFHNLSNANPRVQAYAIAAANGDRVRLLEALRPGGKTLSDVLGASFDNALNKLGQPQIFKKLVGALAFLPAPIAVPSIARIAGCSKDIVRDFALDLAPGLRLYDDTVTVADEDFAAFIKDKGFADREAIIADIAEDFITNFQTDSYSSIHVADKLIEAGRALEVLFIIEQDPWVAAIGDPIVRRRVQVRRLKLSLSACREVDSTIDALKTVLIAAEAERDDSMLNEVIEKELDLSAEFTTSSLRRTILLDPDRVEEHGSFLIQDAARAIRSGDHITAREQLYFYEAWLRRRQKIVSEEQERWTITDRDISARVETILELAGPKAAFNDLMRWRPYDLFFRVAFILIPQLIATGRAHHIRAFLEESPPTEPWSLLLWVPLAMAGESVNKLAVEKSLKRIKCRFIPAIGAYQITYNEDGWQARLLDTFITACELAFKLCLDSQTILGALNEIMEVLEGKQKQRLYGSDVYRLDGLLRCWLLKEAISGVTVKEEEFVAYVKTLSPKPKPEKRRRGKRQKGHLTTPQTDNREINKTIQALFSAYSARLEILLCDRENRRITDEQIDKLGRVASAYEFDYDHNSTYLRDRAAQSIMSLLIIENIKASELVERASKMAKGRFSDLFSNHRQKIWAWMRLRTSESDKLVMLVAKAAEDIKGLRAASSEKLEEIIQLSRLILPISRDDAQSLFNSAIDIAKEIDLEAFDQIDFVSVLAKRVGISNRLHNRKIAADIFSFVSGAAKRLSDRDGFPWESAVHALTCVDAAIALSVICRWADEGSVKLEYTLDRFLLTALQQDFINSEVSTSLSLLIDRTGDDLRKQIVSRAAKDPLKYKTVIEELARETLLLSPQHLRLPLGQEIVDRLPSSCPPGPWLTRLSDTVTFLKKATDKNSDKSAMVRWNNTPRQANNNNLPETFEFDPKGKQFTTPELITELLNKAKMSGLQYNVRSLLKKMRTVSSSPRDRVPFLNALDDIPEDFIWSTDRVDMIYETLAAWKGTPAVTRWCKERLPSVLIKHFYGATRWLKGGQSALQQLLDFTESNAKNRLWIILEGVAQAGKSLNSRSLFAVAEEIVKALDAEEAGEIMFWYAQRLRSRLSAEDQSLYFSAEIPNNNTDTIGRFLFALMGDIDTRIRWKSAHAMRRLAKLGCFDIIKATVLQSSRVKEDAFRDPSAPFYFLAGKLWLAISLYRISAETPEALSSCKREILDLAISPKLPHVGIREYAKRTLLQLSSAGAISLTTSEKSQIDLVNTPLKGKVTKKKETSRSFGRVREREHRFKFDDTDTIPYWYEKILRIFPTVSRNQVLAIADRWIIDEWSADPEANWWSKEPRKLRYDERRFALWSHHHGSFPTIERYGTHLEWNAMHCVIGELLTTNPISGGDDYYSLDYWLGQFLPTDPPEWLCDIRGPTPLQTRLWEEDPRTDSGWLHHIRREEFLAEIGGRLPLRKDWIVAEGSYTVHFSKRETVIRISSALVSSKTAPALVRALQTANDPWDFRIPCENDDQQIDVPPYHLVGWLAYSESEILFDKQDPFRYEVGQMRAKPGRKLTKMFGLIPQHVDNHPVWIRDDTNETVLIYEAWCDEPPPERDYYYRNIRSDGWRLWARSDMVQSFVVNRECDLIYEVQVERRLRNEYRRSYGEGEKRKVHEKILLIRADGSISDIKGRVGSWKNVSKRTES